MMIPETYFSILNRFAKEIHPHSPKSTEINGSKPKIVRQSDQPMGRSPSITSHSFCILH
ncbi:MAG TPA: hypothetical protein V6D20_05440 [Candidatus Obscuribacterales bacterium]